MVKHSKILLAGIISGIVAITTTLLGITGTVIGSVIASIIYTFLSEYLEKPIQKANEKNIENELIFVLPLIIITAIQFLLIMAFLSEWGYINDDFLHVYLSLQQLVSNNLYRILGFSTLLISIYPMFLKTEKINRNQGILLAIVGLIFVFRGFIDLNNPFVNFYKMVFEEFDFYIAIFVLIILSYLVLKLLYTVYENRLESKTTNFDDLNDLKLKDVKLNSKTKKISKNKKEESTNDSKINTSAEDIEFVSNDYLNKKNKK